MGRFEGMEETIGVEILEQLSGLRRTLARLERKVDRIVTTEAELAGKLDDIESEVTGLQATIADLQVGAPVTQEQLDALNAHADKILGHQQAAAQAAPAGDPAQTSG